MNKLRLGVLGLGEGRSIISAGRNSALWDVVQLCDLDADLGAERCREFDLAPNCFTTSFNELLANDAVDVVGIYTPDSLHAEHVICTKPFLDGLSRARDVLTAQRRSGRCVMVGQSTRFFASFMRQREHFE